jgi:hypothetical protein
MGINRMANLSKTMLAALRAIDKGAHVVSGLDFMYADWAWNQEFNACSGVSMSQRTAKALDVRGMIVVEEIKPAPFMENLRITGLTDAGKAAIKDGN